MENLLLDLKNVSYNADDIQRRRDEQTKEWLNSRRPEVSQGNAKRRRTNHCVREFGAQDATLNDGHSEQAVVASTLALPKSSAIVRSGTQSNT